MKFYIQTNAEGYITDIINYQFGDYQEVEYDGVLPQGIMGCWYKLVDGGFELDREKYRRENGEADPTAAKIAESKTALAGYLESHPMASGVHGDEARLYSVTQEKQALLTSALMMAKGAAEAGIPYEITWNAAGQPCEVWTLAELTQLAFEIAAYVKPFVAYQQQLEVRILTCESEAELEAIVIDYDNIT